MLKPIGSLLVGLLVASSLSAADVSGLKNGTVFRYKSSLGDARLTFDGPDGSFYRWRYQRDNSAGAGRSATNWTDAKGRTVQVLEGETRLFFKPHDCWLETGRCRFTVTNSNGDTFRMTQTGKMDDQTFTYELRDGGRTVEQGRVRVDQYGVPVQRQYVDASGEQRWVQRR